MQTVPDLHFFQLAEVIVELCESRFRFFRRFHPRIAVEAGCACEIEDLIAQQIDAPRIDAGGFVIFIDERFEILERTIGFSTG